MSTERLAIAILGMGRMGRELHDLARERGLDVVAALERADVKSDPDGARAALSRADVALEFTVPEAAVANIDLCLAAGCAVVVGTTGWYDRLDEVAERVRAGDGAMLWAANFSMGVAAMTALARRAGELMPQMEGFDAHLMETHHTGKKDAPSGTAMVLASSVEEGSGRALPVTSVRVGSVPGTHELVLDGPYEQLVLRHEARSRKVFADGALQAAAWLRGRTGVYTMSDVLRLEER